VRDAPGEFLPYSSTGLNPDVLDKDRKLRTERKIMVNLEVYEVFAKGHRQELAHEARVSRFLRDRKLHSLKSMQGPQTFFNKLLKRLSTERSIVRQKATEEIKEKSRLMVG
jgi:hypothetical protein